ncbi:unnamed protein product [marine sediment metagenome]|uniref:Uncharacterized protein n=1 Tax=marine sediment metagenome TaxID=412755 RepID=X1NDK2_9ZZZZ
MLYDVYDYSNLVLDQIEASNITEAWDAARLRFTNILDIRDADVSLFGEPIGVGMDPTTEVYVQELPKCSFCDAQALYNGRTIFGAWGYMCEGHFQLYGIGLGTGKGQKLRPRKVLGEAEKILGEPEQELSVTMSEEAFETSVVEGVWYPTCPYCGVSTSAEPDATAIYCDACNKRFKIINPYF